MRFRHAIVVDTPRSAEAAFALLTDLNRIAEWHPELHPPEVTTDRSGDIGHTVSVRHGDETFALTLDALDPDTRTVRIAYSLGFAIEWDIQDHGDAGCLVRASAEVAGLQPGRPETEDFRGALLRDLELLKAAIENR